MAGAGGLHGHEPCRLDWMRRDGVGVGDVREVLGGACRSGDEAGSADGWDPKPEPVIDMVLVPSVGTTSGAGEVADTVGGSYCKPVGVRVAD